MIRFRQKLHCRHCHAAEFNRITGLHFNNEQLSDDSAQWGTICSHGRLVADLGWRYPPPACIQANEEKREAEEYKPCSWLWEREIPLTICRCTPPTYYEQVINRHTFCQQDTQGLLWRNLCELQPFSVGERASTQTLIFITTRICKQPSAHIKTINVQYLCDNVNATAWWLNSWTSILYIWQPWLLHTQCALIYTVDSRSALKETIQLFGLVFSSYHIQLKRSTSKTTIQFCRYLQGGGGGFCLCSFDCLLVLLNKSTDFDDTLRHGGAWPREKSILVLIWILGRIK